MLGNHNKIGPFQPSDLGSFNDGTGLLSDSPLPGTEPTDGRVYWCLLPDREPGTVVDSFDYINGKFVPSQ